MFLAPLINSELILEITTKLMGSAKSRECVHPKSMPNVKAAPMNWPEMCLLKDCYHYHSTNDNISMFLSKNQIAKFD